MADLNKKDMESINRKLFLSLEKSEEDINNEFFGWANNKKPLVNFSCHDGRITYGAVIWKDEISSLFK